MRLTDFPVTDPADFFRTYQTTWIRIYYILDISVVSVRKTIFIHYTLNIIYLTTFMRGFFLHCSARNTQFGIIISSQPSQLRAFIFLQFMLIVGRPSMVMRFAKY